MIKPELLFKEFDENFKLFHDLMVHKVSEILLVSSPYDAFVLDEEGSLAHRITHQYRGLNLSTPPRLTRVSCAHEALNLLEKKHFDLVVTMPFVGEMDAFAFGLAVKKIRARLPVVLLASNLNSIESAFYNSERSGIDNIYVWNGDANLMLAIIKNIEDHWNVARDTKNAMVRVLILVEDSPEYLSFFLPILYSEVVRQTQSVLDESINDEDRLLKMRARPKILVASSYEQAIKLFRRYREHVFGIISDTRFYRKDSLDDNAGVRLLKHARTKVPDLPLLLMSSDSANKTKAKTIPATFIDKNNENLPKQIEDFFLTHLGFGDFVFRLPNEVEVGRATSLSTLEQKVFDIPDESLVYHASCNHFSNWIMSRSEIGLATILRKYQPEDFESADTMRRFLADSVQSYRKWRRFGLVTAFSAKNFNPTIAEFVKIGQGSIGGKARGIAYMNAVLRKKSDLYDLFPANPIKVPKTLVIADDGFVDFIEKNKLYYVSGGRDAIITRRFKEAQLPEWLLRDLRAFLHQVECPLAVRSSSMLEDAQFRPYAGMYQTFMVPNNNQDFEVRFAQLENAIKQVYASTYFEGPRSYSKSISQARKDSMAVIVQQLIGRNYDQYFYPAFSGVAQSYNFYPISYMRPEDGIACIALGFGKTVVEGERCLRFSPKFPKILPQFSTVDDIMDNTQRYLYALNLSDNTQVDCAVHDLEKLEISDIGEPPPVINLCSTYLPDEHRIRDCCASGPKVVTFARILKHQSYPLSSILNTILQIGRQAMGCEVEVEFAVDFSEQPGKETFYLLQIRPLAIGSERLEVDITESEIQKSFAASSSSLGHGFHDNMIDIIYVKPDDFDQMQTKIIAREISLLNDQLRKKSRKYLLIGPGRWGSADHLLGIPVQWYDISGVGAMIELRDNITIEPSQGTHFFQNITSLAIPYLTIRQEGSSFDRIDWSWLAQQNTCQETTYLRHVCLDSPFMLKANGKTSESVIYDGQIKEVSC